MVTKVVKHVEICKKLNELYARKNADYGDSFGRSFREYGLTMVCIRLEDKLNRIKSLSKNAAQVSDESIVDTLMDLANYSIMALVELAQDEPDEPERVYRGVHCSTCKENFPECLCLSCVRDGDPSEGVQACCVKHECRGCYVEHCPDYVKEGS